MTPDPDALLAPQHDSGPPGGCALMRVYLVTEIWTTLGATRADSAWCQRRCKNPHIAG